MPLVRDRVFYGWWIVLSFAVMTFFSSGIRFAVGPFLKPIVADLGLDRAEFSAVVAASLFLYGVFQPFVGRAVDRLGARPVIVGGALLLGASLAATGLATRLWHLWLVYGVLVALGLAATGHVVGSAIITRWFTRRRGTALSTLGGASMAGISLLVPVVMWLILTVGWRWAYVVIGVGVTLLILPLGLWVVRESPEAMGKVPDGRPAPPGAVPRASALERTPVGEAAQTRPFWQLSGSLFTCGFSMSLLSAHGVPMLTDHGYAPMFASWTIGLLGFSSMLFSMVIGAVADRFGAKPMLAWLYGTRAFVFAGLFLIRDQPAALLAVAVIGGVSMAGTLAMTSVLSADIFGRYSVGSVFGTIFLVHQVGAASGSWLAGHLFETTGGYGTAFALASAILLVASVVALRIDERPRCGTGIPVPVAGGR